MVKTKTVMNAKNYYRFNKRAASYNWQWLYLVFGALVTAGAVLAKSRLLLVAGGVLFFCGVVVLVGIPLIIRKNVQNNKFMGENVVAILTATPNQLEEVTLRDGEEVGRLCVMPQDVVRVLEYPDFFYIYITRQAAFLVDKTGFEEGGSLELSQILRDAIAPKKYRIRR